MAYHILLEGPQTRAQKPKHPSVVSLRQTMGSHYPAHICFHHWIIFPCNNLLWCFFFLPHSLLGWKDCRQKEEQKGKMGISDTMERLWKQWGHLGTRASLIALWGIYRWIQWPACHKRKESKAREASRHTKIFTREPRLVPGQNLTETYWRWEEQRFVP